MAVGPFIILAVAAFALYLNWDTILPRFARHWSADGTPNGWTTKSVRTVYGTLILGTLAVAVSTFMASSILRRTRQVHATGDAAVSEWQFTRGNALYLQVSCYLMAVLFSAFALTPVLASRERLGAGIWLIMGVIVVLSVGVTIWMIRAGQGGHRTLSDSERSGIAGDATPDDAWKLGLIYDNPADPALLVEKRMGLGWTLNFGHKLSWLILLASMSPLLWVFGARLFR